MRMNFFKIILINFNPLVKILEDNWLTRPNYVIWKINLITVLIADKIVHVLNVEPPEVVVIEEQKIAFNKWHEAFEMSKCYILTIITNMFQKQCQDLVTTQDMMLHLKEMFGEQSRSARQAHVHQNGGVNSS